MAKRKGKRRKKVSSLFLLIDEMIFQEVPWRALNSNKYLGLKSFKYLYVHHCIEFLFFRKEEACARASWSPGSSRPTGAAGHPWNPRYSRKQRYRTCRTPRTSWAAGTTGRSRSSRYTTSKRNKITEAQARDCENEPRDFPLRLQHSSCF